MTELISIGDAQGVCIPKALIQQAGLEHTKLHFHITSRGLLIQPERKKVREGWAEAIQQAAAQGWLELDSEWLEADMDSALADFDVP